MRLGLSIGEAVLQSLAPSTSGRGSASDLVRNVAPALAATLSRGFASLVGSGVPSPRHDVAVHLSTPHGGHINRLIMTSESIAELDGVLYRFRRELRPANIGAAAMQLEHLHRHERTSPFALKVQRVAAELQKYVETYTDRMALTQVANVVRGLSAVRHRLPPELLVRLAAGVVADGCAALRYAPDVDIRDLFFGFAGQGYTNGLFWSRVCASVLPRLPALDPNTLPAIVLALQHAQQLAPPAGATPATTATGASSASPDAAASSSSSSSDPSSSPSGPQAALALAALQLLSRCPERLQPGRLADAAQAMAVAGGHPGVGFAASEELVERFQAATLSSLPALSPGQVVGLLLGLQRLRRAAGCQPPHLPPALLAPSEPHLRAAAPELPLLGVKRAVQALAPTAAAQAAEAQPAAGAEAAAAAEARPAAGASASAAAAAEAGPPVAPLLDLLARRALQLLPPAEPAQALSPGAGLMARLPRGGAGAGTVLAAVAGPAALDGPTLGALEGLARAYAAAAAAPAGPAGGGEGGAGQEGAAQGRAWALGPGVVALCERVSGLAAAGRARGLLGEAQRASLVRSLGQLLGERAAAPLLAPEGALQLPRS